MLIIDLPGRPRLNLEHLVIDLNGTVAFDGELIDGVARQIEELNAGLRTVLVTADTHGRAASLGAALGTEVKVVDPGEEMEQKTEYVRWLGADSTVAIGNGANDAGMLAAAGVGICVIGPEGAAATAIASADVVTTSIADALGLLGNPARIVATLRR